MTRDLVDQLRAYGEQVEATERAVTLAEVEVASSWGDASQVGATPLELVIETAGEPRRSRPRRALLIAAALLAVVAMAVMLRPGTESDDLRIEVPETTISTPSSTSTIALDEVPGLPSGEALGLVEAVLGSFGPAGPSGARDFSAAAAALGDDTVWVEPDGAAYTGSQIQELFEQFPAVATMRVVGPMESTGDAYLVPIQDVLVDGSRVDAWIVVDLDSDGTRRLLVHPTKPVVGDN